jgi:ribosomal protein L32
MRIDSAVPYSNIDKYQATAGRVAPEQPQNTGYYGPGVIVEISQQAKDYNSQNKVKAPDGIQKIAGAQDVKECQTCKNRKYVDESSDPSVSYQTPQHISPGQSGAQVMAHEREHVANEQTKAERQERRVISQTVSLSTSICPECGRVYVSGGVTRTVTASDKKAEAPAEINIIKGEKNAEL